MLEPKITNSIIITPPIPGTHILGGYNGVPSEPINTVGIWTPYLPSDERQHSLYFDTAACVTYSALNVIETVLNYKIDHKLISTENYKWLKDNGYLDENDKVNFSDRHIAKLSGTTKEGNYLHIVIESIKEWGLVPEAVWNYPRDQRTPVFDRAEYYKTIPQSVKNIGLEFKKRFKIEAELEYKRNWTEALKYSPIQVVVYAWPKPENGIYPRVDNNQNHAIIKIEGNNIYDTYRPHIKTLAENYNYLNYGYVFTITSQITTKHMKIKQNHLYQLVEAPGGIAIGIDDGLMIDNVDKILATFIMRNNGDTAGKTISVKKADWDSVPHYNIKKEKIT